MMLIASTRLLIVGYSAMQHIGAHFYNAAKQLGIQAEILDANAAFSENSFLRRINWRLLGHRPTHLDRFSDLVVERCKVFKPNFLLVTGITPPNAAALSAIQDLGIARFNYLTDDPWNPTSFSHWFMRTLGCYTLVFSPRTSNLENLKSRGCKVSYLPFAYEPYLHYPEMPPLARQAEFDCDILFYGGADRDRIPYIEALINAGFRVHLYGGYWDRYPKTRRMARGMADAQTLRWAVACAKITLCLVRRSNRDGHVMRSFEAPAMGACMLTEDTLEHRSLFGQEGETVVYFKDVNELVQKASQLLKSPEQRQQLSKDAYHRIIDHKNTYLDRLKTIIATHSEASA